MNSLVPSSYLVKCSILNSLSTSNVTSVSLAEQLVKENNYGSAHGIRKQPEEGTVMRLLKHPHKYVQHTSDQCTGTEGFATKSTKQREGFTADL